MDHPVFEIVKTTTGVVSIRNKIVNEIMHNPVGPWLEANSLYINQSKLKDLLQDGNAPELVVFDVGLGAAANALAALYSARPRDGAVSTPRKLRIVSFERDLELLKFAIAHADRFEHFQGYENILTEFLQNKTWSEGNISWELRHGDFLKLIDAEPHFADIVFYDPYSPLVNVDMWTADVFKRLFKKCKSEGCLLLTYSQATSIRAALLCGGFYIGAGAATGLKLETTQAATRVHQLSSPFDERWLGRWSRSHTPFYPGCKPEDQEAVRVAIMNHPQFAQAPSSKP